MSAKTVRMLVRLGISTLILLIFLLNTAGVWKSRLLSTLENVTYDARILMTMPETVDPRVVIIDIDERSQTAEGQWPWPRDKLGKLVTQLFDTYRIRAVGFDMVFPEPDRSSGFDLMDKLAAGPLADLPGFHDRIAGLRGSLDNDQAFAEAIRGKRVVLGYVFSAEGLNTGLLGPTLLDKTAAAQYGVDFIDQPTYTANLPVLQSATAYGGFFDISTLDEDGIIRRVPLMERHQGQVYTSLALALTRVALDQPEVQLEFEPPEARISLNLERVRLGSLYAPVDQYVAVRVPYRGRSGSFNYIPATDVLNGRADPQKLAGAIALVGTTAAGLKDLRATPVGQGYAGVEVHANIISGILDGRIKQQAPYYAGMETFILLVIGLLLAWLFPRVSPFGAFGVTAAIIVLVVGLAFLAWLYGNLVMPLGVPIVFTLAVFLAQLLYGYFIETRRAQGISKLFGEYVPKEVVEEMAANPGAVSMEGEIREMTVLFSDVRGFTTISERLQAKELSDLMNQFLTPQTKVIQKHRGTIDKYMGDAIMAFWGAPLKDPQHATNALLAGMEMVRVVRELDEPFKKRGWPPINIGVGITTGSMCVGNMGSEFRRAYTVMGDPVNLGSRIEGLTKEYGATVMCSEFTRNAGPPDWSYRELDSVKVKGKNEPVAIYQPMGPKDALDPGLRQDLARHRGALKMFRAQQWDQAENEFFSLSRGAHPHKAYELFLERIAYYRKNPPGENWDGVFTFKTK